MRILTAAVILATAASATAAFAQERLTDTQFIAADAAMNTNAAASATSANNQRMTEHPRVARFTICRASTHST